MAQRIRHLTTDQGIPGSNPGRVDFFFFFPFLQTSQNFLFFSLCLLFPVNLFIKYF